MNVEQIIVTGGVSLVAAFFGYLGATKTSKGSIEQALNDRVKIILDDSVARHAECEKRLDVVHAALQQMHAQLREALQFSSSLIAALRRNNIAVPRGTEESLKKLIDKQDMQILVSTNKDKNNA